MNLKLEIKMKKAIQFALLSTIVLSGTALPAEAQTLTDQNATQEGTIIGDNNELNQVIYQINVSNPGKGRANRVIKDIEQNGSSSPTHNNQGRNQNHENRREWGTSHQKK